MADGAKEQFKNKMQRTEASLHQEAADAREDWINASPANRAAATAAYENKMFQVKMFKDNINNLNKEVAAALKSFEQKHFANLLKIFNP